MSVIKHILSNLFKFVWSLYALLTFIILALLSFPILFIVLSFGSKSLIRKIHFLPPKLADLLLKLWLIKVEQVNSDSIPKNKQYVFVGNHRSYLDALVAGCILKAHYIKFIGKAEILNYPFLGYLLRKMYIPVQRDEKESRKWSMNQLFVKATDGASLVVLPEGTCNTGSELLKYFHDGAFRLSIINKTPMAIFTMISTGEIWPRNSILLRPGKVTVYWEEPLDLSNFSIEQIDEAKELVKSKMLVHLQKHYPNGYKPLK